jgi:hypothetical protein
MSRKKNFTKIERHLIKQCMIDAGNDSERDFIAMAY